MNQVVILLGGNIGDREAVLNTASSLISSRIGTISTESPLIESKAWGFESNDSFLNKALIIESNYTAIEVLKRTKQIEIELGRVRKVEQWSSRIIDIDILFYDSIILDTADLCIPHKHIQERYFTLFALNYIMPNYIHPKLEKSIQELLHICDDPIKAEVYNV